MYLHIGENQTVLMADIVAVAPLTANGEEQSAVFLADGSVVLSLISARTLQKRANSFLKTMRN